MEQFLKQAARCICTGSHRDAESILRGLPNEDMQSILQCSVQVLYDESVSAEDAIYTHFVALKWLRFGIIRNRSQWMHEVHRLQTVLQDYGNALGDKVMVPAWRPVISEWCSVMAVVFKLSCVTDAGGGDADAIQSVMERLLLFLGECNTAACVYLHRRICQHVTEEFGLYSAESRQRGLPMRAHRACRRLFADAGVAMLVHKLLASLAGNASETKETVDAGFDALVALLSWPSHSFFEEDSLSVDSCAVTETVGPAWDALLLQSHSYGSREPRTLFQLMHQWLADGHVAGVPMCWQALAESLQLLCSMKGLRWGPAEAIPYAVLCLELALTFFRVVTSHGRSEEYHLLPLLASGILSLVSNFTESFVHESMQSLMHCFTEMVQFLITLESRNHDNESLMACLNEMLSAWHLLACYLERNVPGALGERDAGSATLRCGSAAIFTTYVQCKLGQCTVDEDVEGFTDAFTKSHLQLVACIGRAAPADACRSLQSALAAVEERCSGLSSASAQTLDGFCEGCWMVFTLVGQFLGDSCEGEQPCIPRCFLEMGSHQDDSLLQLMLAVQRVSTTVLQSGVPSPAVHCAMVSVLQRYVQTYIEADESCPLYASAFDGGRRIVDYAQCVADEVLRLFPFDEEATSAVCSLLDVLAEKSDAVRMYIAGSPFFKVITTYVEDLRTERLVGMTRGRLLSFVLVCTSSTGFGSPLTAQIDWLTSTYHSVDGVLSRVNVLAGLFYSLPRADVIRGLFPLIVSSGESLLQTCKSQFCETEIAIATCEFVRRMFTACTPFVEDGSVKRLLGLVLMMMQYADMTLRTTHVWHSAAGGADKVRFLVSVAKLCVCVGQWKVLDCFLPEEDITGVAECTTHVVAQLLSHLDEQALSLPDLEEAAFAALDMCAESFPSTFATSPESPTFLIAIRYALQSNMVAVQRVGLDVAISVVTYLEGSPTSAATRQFCADFVLLLLHVLASGKVSFANTRQVAAGLATVARVIPAVEELASLFEAVASEIPNSMEFLAAIYPVVASMLGPKHPSPTSLNEFEFALQDAMSLVRGVSVI